MSTEILESQPQATRTTWDSANVPDSMPYDAVVLLAAQRYATPAFLDLLRRCDPRFWEAAGRLVDAGLMEGPRSAEPACSKPPSDGDERIMTEGLWDPSVSHVAALLWALIVNGQDRAVIELSRERGAFDDAHKELYLVGRVEKVRFDPIDFISVRYVYAFSRGNIIRLAQLYGPADDGER